MAMMKAPNLNPAWQAAVKRMLLAPPQPQPSRPSGRLAKVKASTRKVRRNGHGK